jgi:hypothetical protein
MILLFYGLLEVLPNLLFITSFTKFIVYYMILLFYGSL